MQGKKFSLVGSTEGFCLQTKLLAAHSTAPYLCIQNVLNNNNNIIISLYFNLLQAVAQAAAMHVVLFTCFQVQAVADMVAAPLCTQNASQTYFCFHYIYGYYA